MAVVNLFYSFNSCFNDLYKLLNEKCNNILLTLLHHNNHIITWVYKRLSEFRVECMTIQADLDACRRHVTKDQLWEFCNVCAYVVYLLCHVRKQREKVEISQQKAFCVLQFGRCGVVRQLLFSEPCSTNMKTSSRPTTALGHGMSSCRSQDTFTNAKIRDVRESQTRRSRNSESRPCAVHRTSFSMPVRYWREMSSFGSKTELPHISLKTYEDGWTKLLPNGSSEVPVQSTRFTFTVLPGPQTSFYVISYWRVVLRTTCICHRCVRLKHQNVAAADWVHHTGHVEQNVAWTELAAECLAYHQRNSHWALVMTVVQTGNVPLSFHTFIHTV